MADATTWHTRQGLAADMQQLGIVPGQTLMVHSALRAIGPIMGGPPTVLNALLDALTPSGTLLMYVGWENAPSEILTLPAAEQALLYAHHPPYDPRTAMAVRDHGILVECFRGWPDVLRSAHPDCSMAALGPLAASLTADHPFRYGYGLGSPLHKLCEADGRVLMLGAPLDTVTLLHYAEDRAVLPGKRVKHYQCPILRDGETVWVDLEEYETSETVIDAPYNFDVIAEAYLATGRGRSGQVGAAQSYLFDAADLARFAIQWLEQRFGNV